MSIDVRCDNCSTVYAFEPDRVPAEGLTVKCSQCEHVFSVTPDGRSLSNSDSDWRVRQANGSVFSFKELTTLQRWIVERKVSRSDEISKTGRNWKRLGDIAELATFFQVVDRATAPQPSPAPLPVQPAPVVLAPAPVILPADGSPMPLQAGGLSPVGNSGSWTVGEPPVAQGPMLTMGADPIPELRRDTAQPSPLSQSETAPAPAPGAPVSQGEPEQTDDYYDDDLDFDVPSGGGFKWVVITVLAVGLIGGAGLYVAQPDLIRGWIDQLTAPEIPQLARGHLNTGYAELHKDSYASIDRAIDNFVKALALAPEYAWAKAGLAEAEIARAEWLALDAKRLIDGMAQLGEQDKQGAAERVEQLRAEVTRRAERAFNEAKDAIRLEPRGLAANRAMADYYRFKRAPKQMQGLLDQARKAGPDDPGVSYVLGSSVDDQAETAERAMRYFDAALEGAPTMQRARFKLAALHARQDSLDKARVHLEALLAVVPEHEQAKHLLNSLNPVEPEPEPESQPEPPKVEEPAAELEMSFGRVLAQADRLRNSDRTERALRQYEKALEMEPDDPDALTGLGWAYLDLENVGAAITTFKRVLKKIPRFSDAHYGIAEAYRAKGMKRDAVKHYRRYLDILPNGPESPVARQALEQLQ